MDFSEEIEFLKKSKVRITTYMESQFSLWRQDARVCMAPGVSGTNLPRYVTSKVSWKTSLSSRVVEFESHTSEYIDLGIKGSDGEIVRYRIYEHNDLARIPRNAVIVEASRFKF